jgi:hypothetical protein
MPLTKVDYSKTIIYKIQHRDNDELLYVGSTTDFTRRKYNHKSMCNNANSRYYNMKIYKMIRDNGGFDCFNIVVIKQFPCNNKQESFMEEDKIMRQMKSNMNTIRAFNTPEDTKEKTKQYNDAHREQRKQYYETHLDKIKQYRLENKDKLKERDKQYKLENKDHIAERNKQYRLENKDKIKQYNLENKERNKQYRLENKDHIAERKKQKITCECGCVVTRQHLTRHTKTKTHQDLLNMTE